jgi:hypothetical protein
VLFYMEVNPTPACTVERPPWTAAKAASFLLPTP